MHVCLIVLSISINVVYLFQYMIEMKVNLYNHYNFSLDYNKLRIRLNNV